MAEPVLAHRITVKPEMWMSEASGRTVVAAVLSSVPSPGAPRVRPDAVTDLTRLPTERGAGPASNAPNVAWRPTVAHFRSAVVAVVVITVALIGRRPDLLVIATPLAVVTAWSVLTRPTSPPTFDERLGHSTIREGDATTWHGEYSGAGATRHRGRLDPAVHRGSTLARRVAP